MLGCSTRLARSTVHFCGALGLGKIKYLNFYNLYFIISYSCVYFQAKIFFAIGDVEFLLCTW